MHNEVNIPSKKWKCSILHKRCPFFSAEQTVRRWTSLGGLVLPAKIVAKFFVMKLVSRGTSDNTTRKRSLIATYVGGNSIQSSCWKTTSEKVMHMWTVTFVIKNCWKVHCTGTSEHTRRMYSNVEHVIMFTHWKITWEGTWRLVGKSEEKQKRHSIVMLAEWVLRMKNTWHNTKEHDTTIWERSMGVTFVTRITHQTKIWGSTCKRTTTTQAESHISMVAG